MKKKAIVHIGFPKTGTTTLQSFLHSYRKELLSQGVLYPETGKLWHAQHELAGLFQTEEKRLYWVNTDNNKPYLSLLKDEIEKANVSTLILSSEAFTFTNNHSYLKDFLVDCGIEEVDIVCFFRRQDLWAESAFSQLYKAGLVEFDFNLYVENQKRLDYMRYLEPWRRVFGQGHIRVGILDKNLGYDDVVPAMIDMIGMSSLEDLYTPERHNSTLVPDALHYSCLIHKENNNELLGWLIEILEEYSRKYSSDCKYSFLSDEQRLSLLDKFYGVNEKLASVYLGRKEIFSSYNGFSNLIKRFPTLEEVDLKRVSIFVLSAIQHEIECGGGGEWTDRKDYIDALNNKIINRKMESLLESVGAKKNVEPVPDDGQISNIMEKGKKVAIVTRTRNRPVMLPRVLVSIQRQTYKNFIWVLVNDAGEQETVEHIANQARSEGIEVLVVHRDKSIGMEAASNDGIRQSVSEYIVIHDDDDTWEAEFLEKTVGYLDEHSDVLGVITWSNRIDEALEGDAIHFKGVSPYNHWLQNIYLSDMAMENRFPPISFLFRRSTYESVGGFDEALPVLGDWDFHLKVLMEGDIHVLPYVLSNYHFRVNLEKGNVYGNTVTSGVDKHILYDAIYRNKKLREDIKNGVSGIGTLLALGQMFRKTNYMSDAIARLGHASKSSRLLGVIRKMLRV